MFIGACQGLRLLPTLVCPGLSLLLTLVGLGLGTVPSPKTFGFWLAPYPMCWDLAHCQAHSRLGLASATLSVLGALGRCSFPWTCPRKGYKGFLGPIK